MERIFIYKDHSLEVTLQVAQKIGIYQLNSLGVQTKYLQILDTCRLKQHCRTKVLCIIQFKSIHTINAQKLFNFVRIPFLFGVYLHIHIRHLHNLIKFISNIFLITNTINHCSIQLSMTKNLLNILNWHTFTS